MKAVRLAFKPFCLGLLSILVAGAAARPAASLDTGTAVPSPGEIRVPPGGTGAEAAGDAERIESAIRKLGAMGGGTVRLSAGVYEIPNPPSHQAITLSGIRNVTIAGEGDSTILASGKDFPDAFFFLDRCSNVTIRNLRFRGLALDSSAWSSNKSWHSGIRIKDCDNVVVAGNRFEGFYTGGVVIQGPSSGQVLVRGNFFEGVSNRMGKGDYGAVAIEEARGAHVIDNSMTGITHSGVSAYNSGDLLIRGNSIRGNKKAVGTMMGIYCVKGLSGSVISSNRIHDISEEGIILDGQQYPVENNVIEGNEITAKFSGITINLWRRDNDVKAASANLIMANDISSYDGHEVQHGIFLNHNERSRVFYNKVDRAMYGINLQNSTRNTVITGNEVHASNTCMKLNGNLAATDNRLQGGRYGILYSYSTETTIARNAFRNVLNKIVKGKDVAGDKVFANE